MTNLNVTSSCGTDGNCVRNGSMSWDDATWILTSAFIIFTMQSGFGLLEAGAVSVKNEVNIMVKNAVDVIFGGISYWLFGFGISHHDYKSNTSSGFTGNAFFAVDLADWEHIEGSIFANYTFYLSFATTATTIVSGAMAERTKLSSYIIFSFVNTVVYSFPAYWIWSNEGFLKKLGVVDIAGSGVVHLVGGTSALVAAILLGPRIGRYDQGSQPSVMGSPANSLIGMFMLWWGWLGFNCGSTFGISGGKWIQASRSAVITLNASMAGGAIGLFISYVVNKGQYNVSFLVNALLGSLVSVTGACALIRPWEGFVVGGLGGAIVIGGMRLLDRFHIDDPVGAIAVHAVGGLWGMVAVGLFVNKDTIQNTTQGRSGLFRGGGFYLLGVQTLAIVCIVVWSSTTSFLILFIMKKTIGIRLSKEDELLGADYVEHGIKGHGDNIYETGLLARRQSMFTAPIIVDSPPTKGETTSCCCLRKRWNRILKVSDNGIGEIESDHTDNRKRNSVINEEDQICEITAISYTNGGLTLH